jgi:serine/threonine-protein kinase
LLKTGDVFGPYTIRQSIQLLDDSAVYKAEDANGVFCALKIFQPDSTDVPPEYSREVKALQKLDGVVNPVLLRHGHDDGIFFLATAWIDSRPCEEFAASYRNYFVKRNVVMLVDLCLSIANAFYQLHRQGLLHGDVHPNNVLVSPAGKVTIIDFGTAVVTDTKNRVVRGGVDFYFEPELAASLLDNQRPVALTASGEQYAVAVLLYKLLSGHHYLPFSYEQAIAYQQIVADRPLPFASFDLPLPASFDSRFC